MPGFTVGILAQEPKLNEDKTVLGNVEEGVAETKRVLDEYNEIAEKMATDYSDELMEQMSKLQEQIDHKDAWDLDSQLEQAMDALRCPPPDADVTSSVRWRAAPGGAVQAAAAAARPAAAGRADQPPGRRVGAVAGAAPGEVRGHGDRDHPRPVLPGERRAVDPRARPRPRLPRTRATTPRTWRPRRPASRSRAPRTPRCASASTTSSSGSGQAPAPGRPSPRRGWTATRRWRPRRTRTASSTSRRSRSRRARGWATPWSRSKNLIKGFDDRVLYDDLSFTLPRNGIVGVIGPNGVGKTTLFKMIMGEEKPDSGTHPRRRHGEDLLLRPEPLRARPEEERLGGDLRRGDVHPRRQRGVPQPGLRRGVRLQGRRPAEAGRRDVRRRAQPDEPRAHPQAGRQPAAARRADQRPGRGDARAAWRTRCSSSPAAP